MTIRSNGLKGVVSIGLATVICGALLSCGGPVGSPEENGGKAPDLLVMSPTVSDPGPAAGARFTLSATVRNAGDGASEATLLRYYRSADATISRTDMEVGTDAVAALAASGTGKESVDLTAPDTAGTYYYGACVDAVTAETDATDNCSTSVKVAVPSTTEPQDRQDLVVTSPTVSDGAPAAGTAFTLSVAVSNAGREAAAATTVRYYQSADATITTSDTEVGTDAVAELAPSGSGSQSVELTAPSTPGTYYYGACVDAVAGESDMTNNCSTSAQVTVPEPEHPELVVTLPSVSDSRPPAGAEFTLSVTVRNAGGEAAAATTVRYYQSADATITMSDTQVGTGAVAELAATGSSSQSVELVAPATAGTYYYGACVDAVTDESDTTNNCSTAVQVTVPEPRRPDLLVTLPSVSDGRPVTGTSFTLSATVGNDGDGTAAATTVRYYRSTDATITTSDTQVGTGAVAELAAAGSASQSVDLVAPSTQGTYYYGACVDAVGDESDTTNNCSPSVEVSVQVTVTEPQGHPDLLVTLPSVSDGRPVTGTSFRLSATVSNDGDGSAAATTLRYYRSTDATITTSDTGVGTDAIAGLGADGSSSEYVDVTAPATAGPYYYGACVDTVTDESDTTNNCSAPVKVDVEEPTHPDLEVETPTVDDTSPETGATFTLSATVSNTGDAGSAATTLRYYRSADATITRSDTQVGTDSVGALAALGSSAESISLTASATAGPYYYGACVDAVTDESDTTDNCSASVEVDVEEPKYPDLKVGTPTVDDMTPETGATITLSATVSNAGDGRSAAATLRYYRSTDATITTSDTQVGTDSVGALAALGSSKESISLAAPSTPGPYYYGACVDAVTGESDTTNNCSASVTVTVTAPKLSVEDASAEEDDGPLHFPVTLEPVSGRTVTVRFATSDATATAGSDYISTTGTLTFAAGTGTQTITVSVTDDSQDEQDESLTVTLTSPSNATLQDATATGVIHDDDDDDDDHGDSQETATTVVPATVTTAQEPISGHLETDGDIDYFRVVADSGETVSAILDASAQPGNFVYRAFVRIESPSSTSSDSSTTVYVRVWSRLGTPTYSLAIWIRDANDPKDTTFDIELMYSSTAQPTASQKAIFRAAADKWESVITEGLDARLISISNMCRNGDTHDFGSWVDDLLIDIRVESIDGAGGVWASAATCTIRSHTSGLPYTSEVTFDSADINRLSSGNLRILALHEMGHALGFGALDAWDDSLVNSAYDYHRENPTSTTLPDTHFLGTAAVSAFNEIADSYTGGKVPVENDTQSYSSGSWDSHWRESVFRTEVMDSVVSSTAEKLSKVTIAALADLGYSVDYSQAESYTLPSSSALHPSPLNIRDEVRRGPVTALPFRDRQIVVIPP